MSVTLSSAEIRQFENAARTLISPLDYPTLNDWRSAVSRSVLPLLRGDGLLFLLNDDQPPAFFSEQVDATALEDYARYYMREDVGLIRRKQRRMDVWSRRVLFPDLETLFSSECYNDWFVPQRYHDSIGMMIDSDRGPPVAGLYLSRGRFGTEDFGERGTTLLHLLLPAFRAGVESYLRLGRARAALFRLLDRTGAGIALFTLERQRVHASPMLEQILGREPERKAVNGAMLKIVASVGDLVRQSRGARLHLRPPVEQMVQTDRGTYRLRGSFVERDLIPSASPLILVEVERTNPAPPSAANLRELFGLTPREAQVALLLAERRSNEEISRALVISEHTARHHTEKVFLKLGVHSRDLAGAKISKSCNMDGDRS